jgi:hypothetical protein
MNVLYSLLLASGTEEAFFAALWLGLGERPGQYVDATFETLRAVAARFSLDLTDSQARKRVEALESRGLVKIEPRRERGRFDFSVFAPQIAKTATVAETATETATIVETKALETVETVEIAAVPADSSRVAPACEDNKYKINIKNKKINQTANFAEVEETGAAVDRTSTTAPADSESVRDVADVRAVVDFEAPKVAALRASIAERIWEPTTHPDLIDRLTAAVVLRVGNATESTVSTIIAEANAERARYDQTNGRAGRKTAWQTATLRVKRLFENAGWRWTPTRFADEPRPNRRAVVAATRPQKVAEATAARPLDELRAIAAGFNAAELGLSFDAFQALVRDRRQPANAIEANALAFEIRGALRELKNS